jgi:DNA polymerase-3 subunit alpha
MKKWFPLCNFTHYSLQRAFSKPDELAKKAADNSYPACGIADYKSISGAVSFYKACIKNDIKPIIGCSFDGYTLFAKNHAGWLELIQIVSSIQDGLPDNWTLTQICANGNLICLAESEDKSPIKGDDFYEKSSAFAESYYVEKSQADLHRILICSGLKVTLPKVKKDPSLVTGFNHFFEAADWYLKDRQEVARMVIDDPRMDCFEEIFDKCENYTILSQPMLPEFETPNGESEGDYLRHLAREGWMRLLHEKIKDEDKKKEYGDQFRHEFSVIEEANLFGYFLIVWDIVDFVVNRSGWMAGPGRGSAAGCLISYLLGITQIDPIEFDLLFERFYNAGRNTEDHISLPDIDIDVPGDKRDEIIDYLKDKYGGDRVSQMLTFGRLQGRSAIKEVLRVTEACSFAEMNHITKSIPNEADISDQLALMDEDERSIIRWALMNDPEEDLIDYCQINDRGELDGEYAEYFRQAIEIEGTFKTQGKHPAGVVISLEPLHLVCPMVDTKSSDDKIAGLEMADLEALGHVKFDVLAINLLDKLMYVKELINEA